MQSIKLPVPAIAWRIIGGLLLLLSIPLVVEWFAYGGFAGAQNSVSLWAIGLTLLTWPWLARPDVAETEGPILAQPGEPSLVLLGYRANLAVLQALAVVAMVVSAIRAEIYTAWWAALIGALLTPLLFRTNAKWLSIALGAISIAYLAYLTAVWDFLYVVASNQHVRSLRTYIIPVGAIAWTMAVIAAFPQLQLLQFGRFGIGKLKGDFNVSLFGSKVPIALASAIWLCCAWRVAWLLWYAPRWVPGLLSI